MMNDEEIHLAIRNLAILANNVETPIERISFSNGKIGRNVVAKVDPKQTEALQLYLQNLIDKVSEPNADLKDKLLHGLFVNLQHFLHLEPNLPLKGLNLNLRQLERKALDFNKTEHVDAAGRELPKILKDKKGLYAAPDDPLAGKHGAEAARIFVATQWERFKALLNGLFARIGIHVFETAHYEEHDYLESDIYAQDLATDYETSGQADASHYWVGHASNFIVIPTKTSPLHVLTDPVEGSLFPGIYPRMTAEGKLIEAVGEEKLPKVDVVVISHNHRDHLDTTTLKRLLNQQPLMIIPEGDEALFKGLGFKKVVALKWWEKAVVTDPNSGNDVVLDITAVPVRHWSGRGAHDAHHSAFNGYVMRSAKLDGDIYFAGDTALMDEKNSKPIFEQFNIKTSIQPGGPDERRADMESTHQSSADGILMHFKILEAEYEKMKQTNPQISMQAFMEKTKDLRTLYNHTATFKLGNLRLRDSYYSFQRMLAAFQTDEDWRKDHLPKHEQQAFASIKTTVAKMVFADGSSLNDTQIANLIAKSVVVPKIGQRLPLKLVENPAIPIFQYRNLISNRRALVEYDKITEDYLNKSKSNNFILNELLLNLFATYKQPWYARFSRNYRNLAADLMESIQKSNGDSLKISFHLQDKERAMGKRNQHGHLQSLIHYAKWLVEFSDQHTGATANKLTEYFACKKVKKLVDLEIHNAGSVTLGSRKGKQKAFKELSAKLADLPPEIDKYHQAVSEWKTAKADGKQSTDELVKHHRSRFFKKKTPHSQATVEHIEATLKNNKKI